MHAVAAHHIAGGHTAVALRDGPTGGPDAWTTATALAVAHPELTVVVLVDVGRRPVGVLALMIVTLDHIAGGRLAVGLFGDHRDEARTLLDRLLRGETVEHEGEAGTLRGAQLGLRPVQQPRPPLLIESETGPGSWLEGETQWSVETGSTP